MKKLFLVLGLVLAVASGCAGVIEPTSIPVAPNAAPSTNQNPPAVLPQAAKSPTAGPLRAAGNCQSKIMGKVLDPNGSIVKGASVEIKGDAIKGAAPQAVTDANGLYGFAGLCAGTYAFTVGAPGKAAQALNVTAKVDGANSGKVDLTLK